MSKVDDSSIILNNAYSQFIIELGNKAIPIPYRRNLSGEEPGLEFQGKSSPQVIRETTIKLAKQYEFDIEQANIEQIREFMQNHKLGIDCSGFIYRLLDILCLEMMDKTLTELGFEHVGRTNIAKLTSAEHAIKQSSLAHAQAGDIIRLNSQDDIWHGLIVLKNERNVITYAHSSRVTLISGVHQGQIQQEQLTGELTVFSYQPDHSDGLYRLKILS